MRNPRPFRVSCRYYTDDDLHSGWEWFYNSRPLGSREAAMRRAAELRERYGTRLITLLMHVEGKDPQALPHEGGERQSTRHPLDPVPALRHVHANAD